MTTTLTEPITQARTEAATKPRRFGRAFLLSFIIVWSAVMLIHFLGNPDGIFPSPRNPSRREIAWKARQFERLVREGRAPTALVLGSSRLMQVLPAQMNELTGARTFNFAAPGDTPLDMLATLRFALSRGARIKHVLIGVDDQAMFGSYDESHETRAAMVPEILAQLPLKERARITLRLPAQVKPELTDEALLRAIDPPDLPPPRPASANVLICDDGYLIYPRRVATRRDKSWNPREELVKSVRGLRASGRAALMYPDGAQISERHMSYLKQLLALCRRHQIRATVILTPVQSDFADATLSAQDKVVLRDLSARLKQLCRRERASYRDLSTIESFAGLPWEWMNFTHALPENVRRMTNAAYGKPPEHRLRELPDDFSVIRNPPPVNSLNTP